MSELPATREWNEQTIIWSESVSTGVQTLAEAGDAMRDELLARIAELEAAVVVERSLVTSAHRAENAKQKALDAERHRAESAEAELHDFKSRHTAAGCGMDVTTGSIHVMTTGAGYVNGAFCVNDVPNSFDHGEE